MNLKNVRVIRTYDLDIPGTVAVYLQIVSLSGTPFPGQVHLLAHITRQKGTVEARVSDTFVEELVDLWIVSIRWIEKSTVSELHVDFSS